MSAARPLLFFSGLLACAALASGCASSPNTRAATTSYYRTEAPGRAPARRCRATQTFTLATARRQPSGDGATVQFEPATQQSAGGAGAAPTMAPVAPAPPPPVAMQSANAPVRLEVVQRGPRPANLESSEEQRDCAPSFESVFERAEVELSSRENDCTQLCRLRTDVCQASRELCELTDPSDPRCLRGRDVCTRASAAAQRCPLCPAAP